MIGLKQGTQLDLKYIDEYEARNYIDALEHKFNKNKFLCTFSISVIIQPFLICAI